MDIGYKKFMREVNEDKIRYGYLLLGENEFLKECLVKEIENKVISPKFTVTDKLLVYGDSVGSDIISWLLSPPFGSKKKLLIIKEAENISPKIKILIQKWLDNPSKTAVLVLMATKNGFKNIPSCNCWKLFEEEVPEWVKSFVGKKGFKIETQAIGFLQEVFGTDIQALASELEKLMSFIEPRKVISLKDTKAMESQEIAGSVFDLTHSIAVRDLVKAEHFLKLVLELDEEATKILWRIYDHFDKLIKLKNSPEESHGIHRYYLPKYRQEASLWEKSDLLEAFSYLFYADLAIKTGKARSDFVLQEVVYKLCQIDRRSKNEVPFL